MSHTWGGSVRISWGRFSPAQRHAITLDRIRNKKRHGYRNDQTDFQLVLVRPIDNIAADQFNLSDLRGASPRPEEITEMDGFTQNDTHEIAMEKWGNLVFGKFRESSTRSKETQRNDSKMYRGVDLGNDRVWRSTATKIHHNIGAPSWARMGSLLTAAGVPHILYDECMRHCAGCQNVCPCDRAPLSRTQGIPITKDVGGSSRHGLY